MISIVDVPTSRRSFLRRSGKLLGGMGLLSFFGSEAHALSLSEFRSRLASPRYSGDANDESFWKFVRTQFLLTDERTYFNNGGLGPSPRVVIDAVFDAVRRLETICETGHGDELEATRQDAARFLGCDPDEIAFTRNTTEGMNIIARGLPLKRGDEVLMSTHEHPGGAIPWLGVAKDKGITVRLFEPGRTQKENLEIIERNLSKRTKVLSLSHMTCTTGTIFPCQEIADLCHAQHVTVVYDGAHPPGMMPVDLHTLGCDFYATSGHKWLLGPKGTGLVYVRKEMLDEWHPTFVGAHSDRTYDLDRLLLKYKKAASASEYGTRNIPLVIGLGKAISFLETIGMDKVEAHDRALADHLFSELKKVPGLRLLTPEEPESRCGIITFKPISVPQQEVSHKLGLAGFRLRSVGEHHLDSVRVSMHVYSSFEEVDRLVREIRKIFCT